MADSKQINFLFLFCCVVVLVINSQSTFANKQKASFKPKSLVLPIATDGFPMQYITSFKIQTPFKHFMLTVDLGGPVTWFHHSDPGVSSTYKSSKCHSAPCNHASEGCDDEGDCYTMTANLIANSTNFGRVFQDVISIPSIDGSNVGRPVTLPRFILANCGADKASINGLPENVKGMAGLGNSPISLPSQLSFAFGFPNKFALCLPKRGAVGVALFGDGPYNFRPGVDASKELVYTPLAYKDLTEVRNGRADYHIGVESIVIEGQNVVFDKSLLSINSKGVGGTKISTLLPYTALETTIYKAFVTAFVKAYAKKGIHPVKQTIAPFSVCFNGTKQSDAPHVDLLLRNNVKWTISGRNSLVTVDNFVDEVYCLGFVDAGQSSSQKNSASITIGGYQLQNRLVQFDLKASQVGLGPLDLYEKYKGSCNSIVFPDEVLDGFNEL